MDKKDRLDILYKERGRWQEIGDRTLYEKEEMDTKTFFKELADITHDKRYDDYLIVLIKSAGKIHMGRIFK